MALDRFLVCGLGSLGQHCVVALEEFGVKVIAIERRILPYQDWEINELPSLLEKLIQGDCRHKNILQQAQIDQCRAALIVTSSEKVNTETAIAIRQLNPHTRLVVRSAQENLNQLLTQKLGNFIAYDATHLPAYTFAISALGTEIRGFFSINGKKMRIIQRKLTNNDPWCHSRLLHELNTRTRRIIAHAPRQSQLASSFYEWEPNRSILPGDEIVYIETEEHFLHDFYPSFVKPQSKRKKLFSFVSCLSKILPKNLSKFWQLSFQQQVHRVALFCGVIVVILLFLGTILFKYHYPGTTFVTAFHVTAILLLGGYSDLFDNFEAFNFEALPVLPEWLQWFALGLTLTGTAFVGVLYALLTQALLSSQFQFVRKRPSVPIENHIIIIGLGKVGQRVANLLQGFKKSIVGVTFNLNIDSSMLASMPLIVGKCREALFQANLATAKSVVVVTDDEILNLEVGLMTQGINPSCNLVIRTTGQHLSETLTQLLPQSQVIAVDEVAAEAFAGAAFGENILNLFRFCNQSILVTEYTIKADDTLNGLLIAEVAYGYGVVPIFYASSEGNKAFMPSDNVCLAVGDCLIVLAFIEGLRHIEVGHLQPKKWQLKVEAVISEDAAFEGANAIARISGCSLAIARKMMNNLPSTLSVKLYKHQGIRLVRTLKKLQIDSFLFPMCEDEFL